MLFSGEAKQAVKITERLLKDAPARFSSLRKEANMDLKTATNQSSGCQAHFYPINLHLQTQQPEHCVLHTGWVARFV